jgi:hypothetical protein
VFLIVSLISGCDKQRQSGIKSDTVVNAIGKEVNLEPTPQPEPEERIPEPEPTAEVLSVSEKPKSWLTWKTVTGSLVLISVIFVTIYEGYHNGNYVSADGSLDRYKYVPDFKKLYTEKIPAASKIAWGYAKNWTSNGREYIGNKYWLLKWEVGKWWNAKRNKAYSDGYAEGSEQGYKQGYSRGEIAGRNAKPAEQKPAYQSDNDTLEGMLSTAREAGYRRGLEESKKVAESPKMQNLKQVVKRYLEENNALKDELRAVKAELQKLQKLQKLQTT